MKKLHTLLLLLGFVFLGYLFWTTGAGRLWYGLTSLGRGLVPFVLLEFVAEGIHTLGWGCCLSDPHRRLPWIRHFRIRMAGHAINYLTPTAALGGEVTKAALLSSDHGGPEAVSGVLAGKLCASIGHLSFVVMGSVFVFWIAHLSGAIWVAMCLSGGLVGVGILTFLLLQKHGKLGVLIRWLTSCKLAGDKLRQAAQQTSDVDEALKTFYQERSRDLFHASWYPEDMRVIAISSAG